MATVFISSVIREFETYRQAAKVGVEAMGHTPLMSETFGARAYSSELACLDEAARCDIFIVILGESYGYETDEGISVTHAEFRAAKLANRPILAFVHQSEMEPKQTLFCQEVEDYSEGFFRQSFSSAADLTCAVASGLRQHEALSNAIFESDFEERLGSPIDSVSENWNSDPELVLAYLPQPEHMVDIVKLEGEMDRLFSTLCDGAITKIRDGYEPIKEPRWTGLNSGGLRIGKFADGLIVATTSPVPKNQGSFSQFFAPPDEIERIAKGFRRLLDAGSGYVHLQLRNMGSAYVARHPTGTGISMRFPGATDEMSFNRLFTPVTPGSYEDWIDHSIGPA